MLSVTTGVRSQLCDIKYFQNNFHHLGFNGFPKLNILPDNSLILTSVYNFTATGLIKMNSSGDTLWSKTYINPGSSSGKGFAKTLNDWDGNLFSVMNTRYLTTLDTAGNVLSTHYLNGLDNNGYTDAAVFPNGDKLVFYAVHNGVGTGGVLLRVDKSMNSVKWSRMIGDDYFWYSNILIDGNTILIAGSVGIPPAGGKNLESFIIKLNGDDGTTMTSNAFLDAGSSSKVVLLYKSGNGYIIDGSTYLTDDPNSMNATYYIRLTAGLNIQASKQFIETPNLNSGAYRLLPQNDGSFYGAYGEFFNLTLFNINSSMP